MFKLAQYSNLCLVSDLVLYVASVNIFSVLLQFFAGPSPGKPRVWSYSKRDVEVFLSVVFGVSTDETFFCHLAGRGRV